MMRKTLVVYLIFLAACQGAPQTPSEITGNETATLMAGVSGGGGENAATPIGGAATESTGQGTSMPAEIVPVPVTSIQIGGLPYQAYQMPDDQFRFVCQEPCRLDVQYIYAEYAGFRAALPRLIQLTGIDTLTQLQPVDMHLVLEDSTCGDAPYGHAGFYPDTHKAYTCTEGPGYYADPAEEIQKASRPEEQYFTLHEYMHTMFFGRVSGKAGNFEDYKAAWFHDYVVLLPSFATGTYDPSIFCSLHEGGAPGDYNGWLIFELCNQNGFQVADFTQSLTEMDNLYQSGGGEVAQDWYEHPAVSVAQYRDILNELLGSDTTPAFAAACWPPELFGNSYTLTSACAAAPSAGTSTPVQ